MESSSSDFDVIISSSTGFLKGLSVCSQNLSSISLIKNENISAMCWCGPFGSEIFVGCHSGRLYRIDVKRNSVTFVEEFSKSHEDSVVALQSYDKSIFVAHTSGDITLFINNLASELRLRSSGSICSAKLAANQIATGGKESALRVWDVNNHNEPIFTAKNVRSSVLELSVPIWIADVSFVPKSNGKLVLTASSSVSFMDIEKFTKKDNDLNALNRAETVDNSQVINETEQKELEDLWNQLPVVDNDNDLVNEDNKITKNHKKMCKRKCKK
uniref:WD repeat protein 74 n=1 Tax=Schistosoma japonicum TaxID=6182 RepID=C1L514_SCHJA|nr:WD repeat protein 74 [Schistosoma japonicum]